MTPEAEVDIDAALVRALLADQHPDLAGLPVTHLDAGWDNSSWRLGDELVVRLPRRAVAVPLAEREHRWLGTLAPGLPLPVPVPLRLGAPSDRFAWPWSIVPWIDGTPGDRATLTDPAVSARRLGAFLAALHRPAPDDAPRSAVRGVPLEARAAVVDERLATLADETDVDAARAVWADARDAPAWAGPPLWLHGDLHPANVLVRDGALAAVIDFGDLCAGDPATDLAGAWMLLPSSARPAFLDAYGPPDAALERRARGWAVLFGLLLLGIGLAPEPAGKPTYERVGRLTLARATGAARA